MPFSNIIGHEGPKDWIRASLNRGHIAHAYLFSGEPSIGKKFLAIHFAQALACEDPKDPSAPDPCGQCRACHQIEHGIHPDFLFIEPDVEKANPQIKIDRIRDLEHHVIYRPLFCDRKICIIDEAHCLTSGAANALLKTLEEPPAHSLFLLITSRPSLLPATVRSRCLTFRFTPPTTDQVEGALILKRNISPEDARFLRMITERRLGLALDTNLSEASEKQQEFFSLVSGIQLQSVHDAFETAERLHKEGDILQSLSWIYFGLRDVLLTCIGAREDMIMNRAQLLAIRKLASQTNVSILVNLMEELQTLEQSLGRNINIQLAMETFFLKLRYSLLNAVV